MKFCEKNVLCEKGDEITRFYGTPMAAIYMYWYIFTIVGYHSY